MNTNLRIYDCNGGYFDVIEPAVAGVRTIFGTYVWAVDLEVIDLKTLVIEFQLTWDAIIVKVNDWISWSIPIRNVTRIVRLPAEEDMSDLSIKSCGAEVWIELSEVSGVFDFNNRRQLEHIHRELSRVIPMNADFMELRPVRGTLRVRALSMAKELYYTWRDDDVAKPR